jgi:hypothetical protein
MQDNADCLGHAGDMAIGHPLQEQGMSFLGEVALDLRVGG